jgi:hypothetical protein
MHMTRAMCFSLTNLRFGVFPAVYILGCVLCETISPFIVGATPYIERLDLFRTAPNIISSHSRWAPRVLKIVLEVQPMSMRSWRNFLVVRRPWALNCIGVTHLN